MTMASAGVIRYEYLPDGGVQLHLEGGHRPAVSGSLTFFNNVLHHFLDPYPDEQVDANNRYVSHTRTK